MNWINLKSYALRSLAIALGTMLIIHIILKIKAWYKKKKAGR